MRLLNYNIHVGMPSTKYSDYLTGHIRHRVSWVRRLTNLKRIAALGQSYDLIALQEADAGSLRSGFVNQIEYIADHAQFPYWYTQLNRNLGKFAQHSNGVMTRIRPSAVLNHHLPGTVPGRGAMEVILENGDATLAVIVVHLALGRRSRTRQLQYLAELVAEHEHVVLMGDMNCGLVPLLERSPLKHFNFVSANTRWKTYPSWKPRRMLDHILVSDNLKLIGTEIYQLGYSDHLPIAVEIEWPIKT